MCIDRTMKTRYALTSSHLLRHFWRACLATSLLVHLSIPPVFAAQNAHNKTSVSTTKHTKKSLQKNKTKKSAVKEPVPVTLRGDTPPAFLAVERKQWDIARALAYNSHNSYVNTAVEWYYLTQTTEFPSFDIISRFIDLHPDFPLMDKLLRRAEIAVLGDGLSHETRAQWFAKHPPMTALGKLIAAELTGKVDKAVVLNAWIYGDLSHKQAMRIANTYRQWIDRAAYTQRVDNLLWQQQASEALELMNYITPDYQPVVKARIALMKDAPDAVSKTNAITKTYAEDKGLLFERMQYRLRREDEVGVEEILLHISEVDDLPHADLWWPARKRAIREALQAGRYQTAAKLANAHGVDRSDREELSEALFLQGWVALVFQHDAKTSYAAFKELYDVVQYPISRARAAYWAARASDKLDQKDEAKHWYEIAASYPTLFYGQIAHQHLYGNAPLTLTPEPKITDAELDAYIKQYPLAGLVKGLIRSGASEFTMPFLRQLAKAANSPKESALAVTLAKRTNRQDYVMRIAKEVWQEHQVMMTETSYPVIPLPSLLPKSFDPAIALAIARQESLFYSMATSPAGARGLMQILPSTAKIVAKKLGFNVDASQLYQPQTNLQIGSNYIHELITKFDGSLVMAIAGYNAGPGRPNRWAQTFGRPNGNLHQTINWIEMIPYNETRNYVMRVLENYQVYRSLLSAGKAIPNINEATSK